MQIPKELLADDNLIISLIRKSGLDIKLNNVKSGRYILKVLKSLYRLKQSPLIYYNTVLSKLRVIGFTRLDVDTGLFEYIDETVLIVFVDDIILITPTDD